MNHRNSEKTRKKSEGRQRPSTDWKPRRSRRPGESQRSSSNRNEKGQRSRPPRHQGNQNDRPRPSAPKKPRIFDAVRYADTPEPKGAFTLLNEPLRQSLKVQGYIDPTPVQEQAIPVILKGRDVLGSAQTGTGKTAAFVLPLLDRICECARGGRRPEPNKPKALILAPTRELADQIGKSIDAYGQFLGIPYTVVYGGVGQFPQVRALQDGVEILVATPGRLMDLMEQGHIDLSSVETFILDEVDRMLDMGFIPDIRKILEDVPQERQTLFFSATLSRKVMEVADRMVDDPVKIVIEPDKPAVERIQQRVYFVDEKNKKDLLEAVLVDSGTGKIIIFTQMKHAANDLSERLEKRGVRATAIHGNKSQAARTKSLDGFKRGRFQVLVATDVAARGLDVDDVTHVINYDMPMDAETYVHRIGRTGRAGSDGDAISFCSASDRALLHSVERHLKKAVEVMMDHEYHCEKASQSRMPAPKPGGGRRSGGNRRGGGNRNFRGRRGRRG